MESMLLTSSVSTWIFLFFFFDCGVAWSKIFGKLSLHVIELEVACDVLARCNGGEILGLGWYFALILI